MSKAIKQMEMDALKATFQNVRDLVIMSVLGGVDCQMDNQLRNRLRKKSICLQVVKNSLTRRVFDELGLKVAENSKFWEGPSIIAWGTASLGELSKALDAELKELVKKHAQLKDRIVIKGAIADGQEVTFAQALKMPTKAEAIGRIVTLVLSPASRLIGQIKAPAARLAAQIKTIAERKPQQAAAPESAVASG